MAGRFLILFGILTILFGVAVLVVGSAVNPADVPAYQDFVSGIFCDDGETLNRNTDMRNADGSQSFSYDCENADGIRREVSGNFILALIGVFVFFLLDGIITTIIGANIRAKQVANEWGAFNTSWQSGTGVPAQVNWQKMGIPENLAHTIESAFAQMGNTPAMQIMTGNGDLTDKLRQLQEARDQNLISQAEYDQLRQALLTGFKQ